MVPNFNISNKILLIFCFSVIFILHYLFILLCTLYPPSIPLNEVNSLTHLLNTDDSGELNIIRHSPYFNDDYLLQSSTFHKNRLNILSINCQSLHAKFDYIKSLIDKFSANNRCCAYKNHGFHLTLIYLHM